MVIGRTVGLISSVEHLTSKQGITGSSPESGSLFPGRQLCLQKFSFAKLYIISGVSIHFKLFTTKPSRA